jgi:hypothetical protein
VLGLLGKDRSILPATAVSCGISALTGVCEELSFRAVLLPILASRLGSGGVPDVEVCAHDAPSVDWDLWQVFRVDSGVEAWRRPRVPESLVRVPESLVRVPESLVRVPAPSACWTRI